MFFNDPGHGFRSYSEWVVPRSLRLDAASSADLNATLTTATDRNKWTFATQLRLAAPLSTNRYVLSADTASPDIIGFNSSDKLIVTIAGTARLVSTGVFRDPEGWGQLTVTYDAGNATASLRLRVYWNRTEITAWDTDTRSGITTNSGKINTAVVHRIGRDASAASSYFNGFICETYLIDGQVLDPTYFTQLSPISKAIDPKGYSGTYGANGFYLRFIDNSAATSTTLGQDFSGNGHDFTPNNISVTAGSGNDSLTESPSRFETQRFATLGTFPTINGLQVDHHGTITNCGMTVAQTGASGIAVVAGPPCYGTTNVYNKFYFEIEVPNSTARVGVARGWTGTNDTYVGSTSKSYGWSGTDIWTSAGSSAYGSTGFSPGDIVGIALDRGNQKAYFRINGGAWAASADPVAGTGGVSLSSSDWYPAVSVNATAGTFHINCGQRPFANDPPSGYYAHLPSLEPHIFPTSTTTNRPSIDAYKYVAIHTYVGSASTQSFSGFGFQPDFIWIMSESTDSKVILDSFGNCLRSNTTAASSAISGLTLDADGFSVPANTSGVSLTGVTYNVLLLKQHHTFFTMVQWTGNNTADRNIAHGAPHALTIPAWLIAKATSGTGNWYHNNSTLTGGAYWQQFNGTPAAQANTNSPFGTGTRSTGNLMVSNNATNNLNANTVNYVAYIWWPALGISVANSNQRGNGANPGTNAVTYCHPLFYLLNAPNAATPWVCWFKKGLNPQKVMIQPGNAIAAVTSAADVDFLVNSSKVRHTQANANTNGRNYTTLCIGREGWATRAT